MFLRETVQYCSACEETTPHSRRIVAVPKLVGLLALVGAGWSLFQDAGWWLLGGLLLVVAILLLLHARERSWGTHCVRCRGKQLAELRGTKPTLDGTTEINLF
ncbi:MAG: hypothetical protein O2816_02590 [Planctomycetota bacterium]|nr:hypothetical protein [Planctomycetota bacterium]